MCAPKMPKQSAATATATPPAIIDTSQAQQAEAATRRKRSGYASLYKTSRLGDMSQPSLNVAALLGGG